MFSSNMFSHHTVQTYNQTEIKDKIHTYSAILSIEACSGAVTFISVQAISNTNPSVLTRVIATRIH